MGCLHGGRVDFAPMSSEAGGAGALGEWLSSGT
jgi:hypothetical protein